MPDVAQQLVDMLHLGWTWGSIPRLMGDGIYSNLTNGIIKELVISPTSEEVVLSFSTICTLLRSSANSLWSGCVSLEQMSSALVWI
jgi:hypothetical protein